MLNSNRIARLTAKYENIRSTLGDKSSHSNLDGHTGNGAGVLTLTRRPNTARRRRIGNAAGGGRQTKLFGGSLEEYLEETNQVGYILSENLGSRVILRHSGVICNSKTPFEMRNLKKYYSA